MLSLFEQKSIWIRQHQTGSGWECPRDRSRGKDFLRKMQKQSKEMIGLAIAEAFALFGKGSLAFVIGCP